MTDRDEKGHYLPGHSLPGPGRDSLYDPAMNKEAHKLALLGLTDEQIAGCFEINPDTLYAWKRKHIAFSEALNRGKVRADAEVAASLYQRAIGETTTQQKAVKNSEGEYEVMTLKTRQPSDPSAAKLWLTNGQKELWSDSRTTKLVGDAKEPVRVEISGREKLARYLDKLAERMNVSEDQSQ